MFLQLHKALLLCDVIILTNLAHTACLLLHLYVVRSWFRNVNLALYSNRITPDRCVTHGCSNRPDMNARISANFGPTIKRERDKWLRYVHTHRVNYNPSGKFVAGVSPSRGGMFFVSYRRLPSSAYSWLYSYNMEARARETNDNAAR